MLARKNYISSIIPFLLCFVKLLYFAIIAFIPFNYNVNLISGSSTMFQQKDWHDHSDGQYIQAADTTVKKMTSSKCTQISAHP